MEPITMYFFLHVIEKTISATWFLKNGHCKRKFNYNRNSGLLLFRTAGKFVAHALDRLAWIPRGKFVAHATDRPVWIPRLLKCQLFLKVWFFFQLFLASVLSVTNKTDHYCVVCNKCFKEADYNKHILCPSLRQLKVSLKLTYYVLLFNTMHM